jgi:hypothetical protein
MTNSERIRRGLNFGNTEDIERTNRNNRSNSQMRHLEVPVSMGVTSPFQLEVQYTGGETTIQSQNMGEATVNSFYRQEGEMSLQENTLHNSYRPDELSQT